MKETEDIHDLLNGGFNGLFGEVVSEDTYKMKSLNFVPDVVFDLGGNVGIYTRFVLELFPNCKVIAVEPNPENCHYFKKFTELQRVTLIEKAIGDKDIFYRPSGINGAHEVYISAGFSHPYDELEGSSDHVKSEILSVRLEELVKEYLPDNMKSIIKIDIEGGENSIFFSQESLKSLIKFDYICMELHWYALHGDLISMVREKTLQAFDFISQTHDIVWDNIYFYGKKRS